MKLDQLYKEHDDILYEIGGADISPSAYIFRFLALMMGIELQGANNLDDRIVPT